MKKVSSTIVMGRALVLFVVMVMFISPVFEIGVLTVNAEPPEDAATHEYDECDYYTAEYPTEGEPSLDYGYEYEEDEAGEYEGFDAHFMGIEPFVDNFFLLQSAINAVPENGIEHVIPLTGNINLNAIQLINITGNRNIRLVGNAFTITGSSTTNAVIHVGGSATFTLDGPAITGGQNGGVRILAGATNAIFNMESGIITGNSALTANGRSGGGVQVRSGIFNMRGGTITGNSANYGGGVHVSAGTFNMEGGVISNNYVQTYTVMVSFFPSLRGGNGGGVHAVNNSNLVMNGDAQVFNNTAYANGGGVYIFQNTTFVLNSGNIVGNTAQGARILVDPSTNYRYQYGAGGGVAIGAGSRFYMYGGEIKENHHTLVTGHNRNGGGGVRVGRSRFTAETLLPAHFIMRGGYISQNTTNNNGGGVVLHFGNYFTMESGIIRGNQANGGGGVITWGNFTIRKYPGDIQRPTPEIKDNTALEMGGGVAVGQALGIFRMEYGEIHNNEAPNGGGIATSAVLDRPPRIYMTGGVIRHNRAVACPTTGLPSGHGGGVYIRGYAYMEVDGGVIKYNHATGHGGGFKIRGLNIDIYPSIIGVLRIYSGYVINNEAGNGGGIYTALHNIDPISRYIYVTESAVFRGNYARNGTRINTDIAHNNRYLIRPGGNPLDPATGGSVSVYKHAFTNHDIFVPAIHEVTIIKSVTEIESETEQILTMCPLDIPEVQVGDRITYRLSITNSRNTPVQNITLTDKLPPGFTFAGNSYVAWNPTEFGAPGLFIGNVTWEYEDGELTFNINGLPRNFTLNIYFDVIITEKALAGLPENGHVPNTATVRFPVNGQIREDSDTEVVILNRELADPIFVKTASPETAAVGDIITYTFTITNPNRHPLENLQILDTLPPGLRFVTGSVTLMPDETVKPYIFEGSTLSINIATIPAATDSEYGTLTITFQAVVLVDAAGSVVENIATLLGPKEYLYCENGDPVLDENGYPKYERSEQDSYAPIDIVPLPGVTKTASPTITAVGGTITYTITIDNTDGIEISDFVVTDKLDTYLAFEAGSVQINDVLFAGYTFDSGTRELRIPLATIPAESKVEITFDVTVLPGAEGVISNTATLVGPPLPDIRDPETGEKIPAGPPVELDTNEENIVVSRGPAMQKTATPGTVSVGEVVTYTFTIANPDPIELNDFLIKDTLPAGLQFEEGSVKLAGDTIDYEITGNVLSIPVNIPANATVEITFRAIVLPGTQGTTITNVAVLLTPPQYVPLLDEYGNPVLDQDRNPIYVPRRNEVGESRANVVVPPPGGTWQPPLWPPVDIPEIPPAPPIPPALPDGIPWAPWVPEYVYLVVPTDDEEWYLEYPTEPTLTHINPIHYAYMIGYREDGTIRPQANMTRAEATTIFFRLISDEYRVSIWSQTNTFADVQLERWFNNAVSTMERGGLFRGIPLGDEFMPNQAITRAEFAAMIVNYLGLGNSTANGSAFTDTEGHWAHNAINVAFRQGWINGFGDGTFRPDALITRAQVAALVNRALGRLPEFTSDLLPNMVRWPDNMNENAWYYLYIQEATNSHYHVMKDCGVHETWTELITPRNWRLLERPYSTPDVFTGLHIGTDAN